jgi:DNA-binding transcriptional LysR family regulator
MDLQALRCFVATIGAGSFAGDAARRLGLTQPAVGRQVRLPEKALGVPLVAPVAPPPCRLAPAPSGEMLPAGARRFAATLERLRQDALDHAAEPIGCSHDSAEVNARPVATAPAAPARGVASRW